MFRFQPFRELTTGNFLRKSFIKKGALFRMAQNKESFIYEFDFLIIMKRLIFESINRVLNTTFVTSTTTGTA